MLMLRIRACHVYGRFTTKANKRPAFGLTDALENPRRDLQPHRHAADDLRPREGQVGDSAGRPR